MCRDKSVGRGKYVEIKGVGTRHMCLTLHDCPYIFAPPYAFAPTLVSLLLWPALHFFAPPYTLLSVHICPALHVCPYIFAPPYISAQNYIFAPAYTFVPTLLSRPQFYPTLHFCVGRDTKKWAHFVSKKMGPLGESFTQMSVLLSHVTG